MFLAIGGRALVPACIAQNEATPELAEVIAILAGITFGIVLLPHILAAATLAAERTFPRILSAILIHTALSVATVIGRATYEDDDRSKMWIIVLVTFAVAVVAMSLIYRFSTGRAILYTVVVNLLSLLVYRAVSPIAQSTALAPYFTDPPSVEEAAAPAETNTRQPEPVPPTSSFASVQAAQAEAIRRFPDLGKAGSAFNQRFLEKHRRYQREEADLLSGNDWPVIIAAEVAAEQRVP